MHGNINAKKRVLFLLLFCVQKTNETERATAKREKKQLNSHFYASNIQVNEEEKNFFENNRIQKYSMEYFDPTPPPFFFFLCFSAIRNSD